MANRQSRVKFRANLAQVSPLPPKPACRIFARSEDLYLCRDCCVATGKLRHNCQLLGHWTALYGRRGM